MATRRQEGWKIDRHVPVALIFAMVIQTTGGIWYASQMAQRLADVETKLVQMGPQGDRLTKLETKFDSVIEKLGDIKDVLTRSAALHQSALSSRPLPPRR
jgi:hypothetical protein